MPNYSGRISPPSSVRNFAGVSYPSSELNQNPNGAIESVNWDLTSTGSLNLRQGWQSLCDFTDQAGCDGIFLFVTETGAELHFEINNGVVWSIIGGTKTPLVATGCTITPGVRWRGAQWKGMVWLANGVDAPIVIIPGTPSTVKPMVKVSQEEWVDTTPLNRIPAEWGANPPIGFTVVNRGQDERMYAWNRGKVYFSSLNSATDWLSAGLAGSGAFVVSVADGDAVSAVVPKFGYLVVFTNQRTLIYTGDGPGDLTTAGITLSHMLMIGCPGGADSIIQVGTDTYFWSEFGPANLVRLLNATELSSNLVGLSVQPHVMNRTNRNRWPMILGYHDIQRRRVVWFAPLLGSPLMNCGYIYQYDIKSWYRYEGWNVDYAVASATGVIFAGVQTATTRAFAVLHSGFMDGAEGYEADYYTVPFDWGQPDITKTVPFVDVFTRNDVNELQVEYKYDFDPRYEVDDSIHPATENVWGLALPTPPGVPSWDVDGVWEDSNPVVENRVELYGQGKFLSFRFKVASHGGATEILGWKPSPRMKGLR